MSHHASPLAPVRRIITGHSAEGKAIVLRDEVQPPILWSPDSVSPVYDIHATSETPARLDSELKDEWADEIADLGTGMKGLISKNGSVVRVFDYAPGRTVPMHRTFSIDYGVCMKGVITLELDDGKRITLKEGDVIVQRGTVHAWYNESETEWGRMFFVVIDAHPIEIDGKKLE